jgi:hypothetical protein
MSATSELTGASDLISGMSLILALARLAVCLMCQIKMPSDLTSDFCLLGPIWVWVPVSPYGFGVSRFSWSAITQGLGRAGTSSHHESPSRGMAQKAVPRYRERKRLDRQKRLMAEMIGGDAQEIEILKTTSAATLGLVQIVRKVFDGARVIR